MKNGRQNGRFAKGSNGGYHGKPGRSDRKPNELKRLAAEFSDEVLLPMLAALATDGDLKPLERIAAAKLVLEYNKPKPAQTIEHTGTIEFQEAARTFEGRIDSVVARLGTAAMPEWPERA